MKRMIIAIAIIILLFLIFLYQGNAQSQHKSTTKQSTTSESVKHETAIEERRIPKQTFLDETETKIVSTNNCDESLNLSDVLDNKEEFYISSRENVKVIYMYADFGDYYTEYIINVNCKDGNPIELPLPTSPREVYILCPDYSIVRSTTFAQNSNVEETMKYSLAKSQDEPIVGGDLFFRVFKVNAPMSNTDYSFKTYNVWEEEEVTADTELFGQFTIEFIEAVNQ